LRAIHLGKRAVLNIVHKEEDYDLVTNFQIKEIFPYIKKYLHGNEKICLDFGCGPGRFTRELASLIHGKAIGVDPIRELIELAPKDSNIEYHVMKHGKIPLKDKSVDLLWCCLVLGGIPENIIRKTVKEMLRVLVDDGLMILIENTSEKVSNDFWKFRAASYFQSLFQLMNLVTVHEYYDCDETISVMIGRKNN
jgi:ubiquinone/menaquinone biosynthesis C-methylase UbiE